MENRLNRVAGFLLLLFFSPFVASAQGTEKALEAFATFLLLVGIGLVVAIAIVISLIITRKKWLLYSGYVLGSLSVFFGGLLMYNSANYSRNEFTDNVSGAFIGTGAFYFFLVFMLGKMLPPKKKTLTESDEPAQPPASQNLLHFISGILWFYLIYTIYSNTTLLRFFDMAELTLPNIIFLLLIAVPIFHLIVALIFFMRKSLIGWLLLQVFLFTSLLNLVIVLPLRVFVFQKTLYNNTHGSFFIQSLIWVFAESLLIWLLLKPSIKDVFGVNHTKIKLCVLISILYLAIQVLAGFLTSR